MAKKKKSVYKLFPNAGGDLYPKAPDYSREDGNKFSLNNDLSQQDLEYLFNQGFTNVVYKIEG